MNRQVEKLGGVTVLALHDPILDASNAAEFKKTVKSLLEESPRLVLDLAAVAFMDSSGCGAILTAVRWLDQIGGELKICRLTERVQDVFSIFRMNRILDIFASREEALRSFGGLTPRASAS